MLAALVQRHAMTQAAVVSMGGSMMTAPLMRWELQQAPALEAAMWMMRRPLLRRLSRPRVRRRRWRCLQQLHQQCQQQLHQPRPHRQLERKAATAVAYRSLLQAEARGS